MKDLTKAQHQTFNRLRGDVFKRAEETLGSRIDDAAQRPVQNRGDHAWQLSAWSVGDVEYSVIVEARRHDHG